MSESGGRGSQACAACKLQRRRCGPDCALAPFFPAERPGKFHAVYKVYGVSNLLKMINSVNSMAEKQALVDSLCWEAECRQSQPVEGCLHYIIKELERIVLLQQQADRLTKEVSNLRQQLQELNPSNIPDPPCLFNEPYSATSLPSISSQKLDLKLVGATAPMPLPELFQATCGRDALNPRSEVRAFDALPVDANPPSIPRLEPSERSEIVQCDRRGDPDESPSICTLVRKTNLDD